ncbi:Dam family site-specific DNA-(adenine-N6)-methyltransferase [Chloracidobacterium aggregatum]|uniref:DNA adenine methylase n=1 Tax=Chloracidobacterium aggregatum TaxID=2851959 RepID=UPI001B8B0EEC|nr:Dam family site-specific DNA-(adenine-N6)-methyltransferase [Chloracidobacterium aggregatum]QUV86128.1 Dam family site-specific DNA-(adenine-N6)-methyltransferase [Chloracidobacterium sp. 2]QUV89426.1 Dam family site-specific DNA-(adenine-N6)-methyltransferase [Chloracidobacterium sp. S]QUV98253.1 Dam family site-specific DNA-(adenine-N6)-methyltransferase [Chloracidobacterium sp. E]
MTSQKLPWMTEKVIVPPIKCQGIKTKLVKFILSNTSWSGKGRWVEPFLGSGVVLFNLQPERALVNDINPHIINLYRMIYEGSLSPEEVGRYLTAEGKRLLSKGEEHYYFIRERFNKTGDPLDFIFLNRSCFNGVMRFNSKGQFNVPFCRKLDRFRPAYVTKIVNQILKIKKMVCNKDWEFRNEDWRKCLEGLSKDDFVYLDPPYVGRHADYYQRWSEREALELARIIKSLPCGFALSMWKQNKYRINEHLEYYLDGLVVKSFMHFYHVGSSENLRNSIEEVLLIKPGCETAPFELLKSSKAAQLVLALG